MTLLLALAGCPVAEAPQTDSAGDEGTSDSAAPVADPPECPAGNGYVGEVPRAARTLSGEGWWTVDFDSDAEARGLVDCSYHRSYPLMVEREGHGWQCPECSWFTLGDGVVDEGYDACLTLISSSEATRAEHLGLGEVAGEPHLYRRSSLNLALVDMGVVTGAGTEADPMVGVWEDTAELTEGGTLRLAARVKLVASVDESTEIHDVNVPREAPYACGWSACNPGGPVTDWVLATGATLPNARLLDTCGEEVDLWDFWGRYLVIDASSPDCGPCQILAQNEASWVEEMANAGIIVEWVTLLNASLGAPNESPDADALRSWQESMGTTGPILADEGYAYTLFPVYTAREDGMGLPTMIVVNPDMKVLGWDTGFSLESSGGSGFTVLEGLIEADAASRP